VNRKASALTPAMKRRILKLIDDLAWVETSEDHGEPAERGTAAWEIDRLIARAQRINTDMKKGEVTK
jgi:hypothetical protein